MGRTIHRKPCGCTVTIWTDSDGVYEEHDSEPCPLHESAPELLAVLESIVKADDYVNDSDDGGRCFYCGAEYDIQSNVRHSDDCDFIRARAAIALAKGA